MRLTRSSQIPVEVDPELTDDDLNWVNEHLEAFGLEPANRRIDFTPDPRLTQIVYR